MGHLNIFNLSLRGPIFEVRLSGLKSIPAPKEVKSPRTNPLSLHQSKPVLTKMSNPVVFKT